MGFGGARGIREESKLPLFPLGRLIEKKYFIR